MGLLSQVKVKRVYDKAANEDGVRILVDRLWPRGLKKETARVDLWLKDLAPSDELRRWFSHDPKKWVEFKDRYHRELNERDNFIRAIFLQNRLERVTLLYAAKDGAHNNAVALKEDLARRGIFS